MLSTPSPRRVLSELFLYEARNPFWDKIILLNHIFVDSFLKNMNETNVLYLSPLVIIFQLSLWNKYFEYLIKKLDTFNSEHAKKIRPHGLHY